MAIELATFIHNYDAEYWRIIKIEFDICEVGKELRLSLGLYKDKATREANGLDYVEVYELKFNDSDFLDTLKSGNILSLLYDKLIEPGEFLEGGEIK